ncbi:MAG: hypothetical protein E7370_03115 [Clostridiales bacterium]|nr:hypothetical protein [Clostridiales bacterium]
MYFYELISAFSLYGEEVILFAFLTTVAIQIAKNNLLKSVNKRLLTFMPFLIGTVIYAVYLYFSFGIEYLLKNATAVFEHGIAVGTLSTFMYIIYEQFIRKTCPTLSISESLALSYISTYVKEELREDVAKKICEVVNSTTESEGVLLIKDLILQNAQTEILDDELIALCSLIYKSLISLSPIKNSVK